MVKEVCLGQNNLWNCLGTYYQAILDCNGYDEEWLNIFQGCSLKFKSLEREDLIAVYGNNPWGYQPIEFFNTKEFNFEDSMEAFFYNKGIKLQKILFSNPEDLKKRIHECVEGEIYMLINVDEFYLQHLKSAYLKQHTKHFLLVLDKNDDYIRTLDTEIGSIVDIPIDQIIDSIQFSVFRNMMIYCLYLPEIRKEHNCKYNFKEEISNYLTNKEWKEDIFNDLYKRINCELGNYYIDGISCTISYKIIPYLRWIFYLCKKKDIGNEMLTKVENEISIFRKLNVILKMEIRKHNPHTIERIKQIHSRIMSNY